MKEPFHAMSKLPVRYYVVPSIYLIIIAALLYGYFGGAERVKQSVGDLTVTALYPARSVGGNRSPSELSVRFADVEFVLHPFGLLTAGRGTESRRSEVLDYSIDPDSVTVRFSDNTEIVFANRATDRVEIEVRAPDEKVVRVGLKVAAALYRPDARVPVYTSGETVAVLPADSLYDEATGVLWLVDGTAGVTELLSGTDKTDPLMTWLRHRYDHHAVGEGIEPAVDAARSKFLDLVYDGWIGERYDAATETWLDAEGSATFDEEVFSLMVSEVLRRGEFRSLYARILRIARSHATRLTYRSAPILGNVVALGRTLQPEDEKAVGRIRELLESNDPRVFAGRQLVPFVFDRAPYAIVQGLTRLAAELPTHSATPETAVGAVKFVRDARRYDREIDRVLEPTIVLFDRLIFPFIVVSGDGLFLADSEGRVDSESTVRAGVLLSSLDVEDPLYARIAAELQLSGLSLVEKSGFLPLGGDAGERIAPERVFRELSDNPYFPREVSLFSTDGPGVWMWTAAGNVEFASDEQSYTISFDFPVGSAHHLIVRGIKPFRSLTLFGIPWKSDPLFQNYTSGWVYEAETQTLFMKITHRTVRERVVIRK